MANAMYGGTKAELERLVEDANKYKEAMGEVGDLTADNFADVVEAIHTVQEQMGITGATAQEAATTIEGSVNSMKAAWENWLTALGREDVDLSDMTQRLVDSVITALGNIVPRAIKIMQELGAALANSLPGALSQLAVEMSSAVTSALGTSGVQMVQSLSSGLAEAIPQLMSQAMPMIAEFSGSLRENAGQMVDAGIELLLSLAQGIADSMPTLIAYIPEIVTNIAGIINDNAPKLLLAAGQLIITLVAGLIQSIPVIIENLPQIINAIVNTILAFNWLNLGSTIIKAFGNGINSLVGWIGQQATNISNSVVSAIKSLPSTLMSLGSSAVSSMGSGITGMIGWLGSVASSIGSTIVSAVASIPGQMVSIGSNIVHGIWSGISGAAGWLKNQIAGFASGVVSNIKGFFGIKSPSRVMRDQVGRYLAEGISVGFDMYNPMDDINKSLSVGVRASNDIARSYMMSSNDNSRTYSVTIGDVSMGGDAKTAAAVERFFTDLGIIQRTGAY